MSNDQWGLKPIQSPRRNSLTDFFRPNEEWFKRPDVKENFATSEEIFTLGCLSY